MQGTVWGELLHNMPDLAFNLHGVEAIYSDRPNQIHLHFSQGFGQFHLHAPRVLFLGTNTTTVAFFCFNDRGGEASVFDGSRWLASGWDPSQWRLQTMPGSPRRSLRHGQTELQTSL
ncbi:MAG: hypothetical protein HC886_20345 [Leptolyngbyaceae cyanobacterium SM1_1_3]|nr:hypothetical protein [Leptolyngbyaceae cyanobacterium SM1_1_3]NJM84835.1 hypothetical protein [Leptolyngbyaceae cyanobacterium RM2_2_21]NJN04005.1 hypothetical protein [Leptolyngbyaceae cyanobacterium RM1_1_2]NJO10999.1 hypothetical protein [Leptolyngbyaceae cyanobacterium SL_1_1]